MRSFVAQYTHLYNYKRGLLDILQCLHLYRWKIGIKQYTNSFNSNVYQVYLHYFFFFLKLYHSMINLFPNIFCFGVVLSSNTFFQNFLHYFLMFESYSPYLYYLLLFESYYARCSVFFPTYSALEQFFRVVRCSKNSCLGCLSF